MPVVLSPRFAIRSALLLGLAAGGLAVAPPVHGEGDPEKGRQVAERWCARCHVIGHAKRYAGIDSSPSFFLMHAKLEDYRERLATFQDRRPHIAQALDDVAPADIEHLIAYIAGLTRPE
jgi:mono/diheme cytochrome c family protein